MDAFEAERREIREKRFTSLDRMILRGAVPDSENPYSTLAVTIGHRALGHGEESARQQHVATRLAVLADMGLARHSGGANWRVRADLENVVKGGLKGTAFANSTWPTLIVCLAHPKLLISREP